MTLKNNRPTPTPRKSVLNFLFSLCLGISLPEKNQKKQTPTQVENVKTSSELEKQTPGQAPVPPPPTPRHFSDLQREQVNEKLRDVKQKKGSLYFGESVRCYRERPIIDNFQILSIDEIDEILSFGEQALKRAPVPPPPTPRHFSDLREKLRDANQRRCQSLCLRERPRPPSSIRNLRLEIQGSEETRFEIAESLNAMSESQRFLQTTAPPVPVITPPPPPVCDRPAPPVPLPRAIFPSVPTESSETETKEEISPDKQSKFSRCTIS